MAARMEELIARGFCARSYAHEIHLQTRKFAVHEALGAFYEDVVPALDRLAEAYQGRFGVLERFRDCRPDRTQHIRDWLRVESDWICENAAALGNGDPAIENLVQDVLAVYYLAIDRLGRS
jgi:hypothetical protein